MNNMMEFTDNKRADLLGSPISWMHAKCSGWQSSWFLISGLRVRVLESAPHKPLSIQIDNGFFMPVNYTIKSTT